MYSKSSYLLRCFLFSMTLLFLLMCAGASAGAQLTTARSLISVTFSIPNSYEMGGPPPMSGPEPSATDANRSFGKAKVWNNLPLTFGVLTTDPSWSHLVDSEGARTGVKFAVAGSILPVNLYPYTPSEYGSDTLRSQFMAWNSWNGSVLGGAGPGESTAIEWTISGLEPDTEYDMFVYGAAGDVSRSFDMTIEGRTMNVPTYLLGSSIGSGGVYFAHIHSDREGRISGVGMGVGDDSTAANEANWSGFQLVRVRDWR